MIGSVCRIVGAGWTSGVLLLVVALTSAQGRDEESLEQAIKKDRERIKGTWRVVAVEEGGEKTKPEEGEVAKVVNDAEGGWEMYESGKLIAKGTSTIDPSRTPKTIDLVVTEGEGKGLKFIGIYELGEDARKLCIDPLGKTRPKEFAAPKGSSFAVFHFQREASK